MSEPAQTSGLSWFGRQRSTAAMVLAWTVLIAAIVGGNFFEHQRELLNNAGHEARISFQQEMLIRFWQDNHREPTPAISQASTSPPATNAEICALHDSAVMRHQMQRSYETTALRSHLTSLKPLEPRNLPDTWEASALQAFAHGENEVAGIASINGQEYMRVMRPLVNEASCVPCHGTQDFKIGGIRGGMSVSVPLEPLRANVQREFIEENIAYGLIWMIGFGGIVLAMRRMQANASERVGIVEVLKDSEMRYRTLADSGQALIWTSGTDKKCDYFNKPWLTFTGRTLAQEQGDGWAEGVHPDDLARCFEIYTTAFDRRECFSMDYRMRRHDGEFRWIQDNGTPRFDSHGNFLGYIGHCLDITDRVLAEKEMKESEDRFRSVVEGAAIPVFVTLEMRFTYLNPAALQLFGVATPEELIGRPILSRIHEDYHEGIIKRAQRAFRGERKVAPPQEEVYLRMDGTPVSVEVTSSPIIYQGQHGAVVFVQDITDRKRNEEQSRQLVGEMVQSRQVLLSVIEDQKESAEQLRKLSRIVEQAPISIVITDLAGIIEYANPIFCAVTGYALAEVLGQNTRVLKSGLTPPAVYDDMWQTLGRGEVWRGELRNKKKNGELYDEQVLIAPVTDNIGKITHYVALKQDVTYKKKREEALRESEQRFRELFDLVSDPILVMQAGTGRIVQANMAASATYGYTVAELLARTNEDISAEPEKTRAFHEEAGREANIVLSVPLRLHRKRDGTVFPTEITARSFRRNGQILIVTVIRNISEQVKARQTLERFNLELEEKVMLRTEEIAVRNCEIEALLQSVPDLVMRLRSDGTVLSFRPAKGETPLARVAKTMIATVGPTPLLEPLVKAALPLGSRALEENATVTAETEIALGVGPLATELRVAPIGMGEFVVFARDITERKRLDAAMVAMLEKERQVSEMKSRFISMASHEFRTPMAVAVASSDLLRNHFSHLDSSKREELFARISSSLNRLTQMIDEVLLLSRINADRIEVRPGPVELEAFTHTVIEEIRMGDRDAHRFELHATGDTAGFVTDPDLLRHILSNLLSNAVRYSPEGTVVTTHIVAEDGRVLVIVEDRGIGVPEADRERIFESFERGSNVGTIKGTGLGLDIVKRMTGLLGGTITTEARAGGGSRFILSFPRIENPADISS